MDNNCELQRAAQFDPAPADRFSPEAAALLLARFFEAQTPGEVRFTDSMGREWQIREMWPEGDTLRISILAVPNFELGDR